MKLESRNGKIGGKGEMKRFLCVLLLLALCFTLPACNSKTDNDYLFYFLDVGQGDSILLRTPKGDILIDAGTEDSESLLCLRLEQLGVRSLRLAVFTHADEDHIGGADGVLSRFPADAVWLSGAPMENEAAERLLRAAEACNSEIRPVSAGEVFQCGALVISVLAPFATPSEGGNENSLILRIQHENVTAILTGDADVEAEAEMVVRYGAAQLACDLYKVGHHGSNTSSSLTFLQAMEPAYAVISCGAGNSYGHPTGEVLARLDRVGARVLRTDLCGEILFESNGQELVCLSHP
ncbi:MAG: MBL fold metallo-hydrolase [Ruminococcaceae bacterium]|nr:MBL fold metallo-hydrolase [Oscillospiraceae bacterium]